MVGIVLDMTADVLKFVLEELGKEAGIYMELLGNKYLVLIKLVDAMDGVDVGCYHKI